MSGFSLDGYTTVNQRILAFYEAYPKGVITTQPARIVEIGSALFISVIAEVYTTEEDFPLRAEAWEVYPGKTPYTRDSEMMNAATSAIGRALMQLGIGIDKAAASADEVKVAQERRDPIEIQNEKDWRGKKPPTAQKASEKQIAAIKRMMGTIPSHHRVKMLQALVEKDDFDQLTNGDVDWFFKTGSAGIVERYQALSAIWSEQPEDDPWAGMELK